MTLATWFGFLLAAIVIAVSPGPGAVASMSTGARYGYWSALVLIAGLQGALLIQLAVVGLGLGAGHHLERHRRGLATERADRRLRSGEARQ